MVLSIGRRRLPGFMTQVKGHKPVTRIELLPLCSVIQWQGVRDHFGLSVHFMALLLLLTWSQVVLVHTCLNQAGHFGSLLIELVLEYDETELQAASNNSGSSIVSIGLKCSIVMQSSPFKLTLKVLF